jgi:hypothetical protein
MAGHGTADSGTADRGPEGLTTTPLSPFATAISTLQGDPSKKDSGPSIEHPTSIQPHAHNHPMAGGAPDLVVARQIASTGAPKSGPAGAGRSPSAAPSSGGTFSAPARPLHLPELVVARRLAPDEGGNLPAADVRLPALARPTYVQRSMIADLPPLVEADLPATAAPAVQQIRYEEASIPAYERGGAHAHPSAPATPQPVHLGPATTGEPTGSPSAVPAGPAPAAAAPPGGMSVQRLEAPSDRREFAAPTAVFTTERLVQPTPAPPATAAPMVQRQPEQTASTTSTSGSFATTGSPVTATSGRTVGLAEMFAIAAAQAAPDDEPAVQRSAETEIQLAAADPAPAPTAAPTAAAPGGAPSAGGPAGADLDEMARRLYEPLSARLRAELWQDRERSGLLTDLRP